MARSTNVREFIVKWKDLRVKGVERYGIWGGWLRRQMRRWGFGRVRMRLVEICGGGRVETERVFGWSFLAEMLVGRYEGTRSPFFPPSLLPATFADC